jgi:hypothetical protein
MRFLLPALVFLILVSQPAFGGAPAPDPEGHGGQNGLGNVPTSPRNSPTEMKSRFSSALR